MVYILRECNAARKAQMTAIGAFSCALVSSSISVPRHILSFIIWCRASVNFVAGAAICEPLICVLILSRECSHMWVQPAQPVLAKAPMLASTPAFITCFNRITSKAALFLRKSTVDSTMLHVYTHLNSRIAYSSRHIHSTYIHTIMCERSRLSFHGEHWKVIYTSPQSAGESWVLVSSIFAPARRWQLHKSMASFVIH